MNISYSSQSLPDIACDSLVCFVEKTDTVGGSMLRAIDAATDGAVDVLIESEEFTGKSGETAVMYKPDGFACTRLILLGLGEKKSINPDSYRKAAAALSKIKAFTSARQVGFYFDSTSDALEFQASIEGFLLSSFKLLDYKSGDDKKSNINIENYKFVVRNNKMTRRMEKAVEKGVICAEAQMLVRTLGSTPSNYLTPSMFADKAKELARKYKLKCKVLDENAIVKEKMGALLAVAKGSDEPPRFIILEYNGAPASRKPVVLVGKGVTFDSGGISLKPGLNMHEMKGDMCGAAVVLSSIVTAARLGVKQNIVALIPATENMPSGKATKPGDIHVSRKGLTIENINTDAEGRLILADALDYANKFKPQAVIDIATLTGATLFILGYAGAPIMGNNQKLLDRISDASQVTAEKTWQLPIWDEHRDQMKSSIADVVNSGGRPAGTITAAAFLENFIGDYPWAHIDIAYVDIEPSGKHYLPKGVTGIGARLVTEVLSNWKKL